MSFDRKITALSARCGYESESIFRNAIKGLLKEDFGVSVKKWEYYDEEGFVYWYPSTVEVDVLIKDSKHILVEIKSSISKNDVAMFLKKGELYKKVVCVEPELMIVSPFIEPEAEVYAKDNKIRIYTKNLGERKPIEKPEEANTLKFVLHSIFQLFFLSSKKIPYVDICMVQHKDKELLN